MTRPAALAGNQLNVDDIGLLAVGLGPGSFTGIRVGLAAAKGLALPRKLPIKGASSFDALALTALPQMPPDCPQLCVLCDARQDEIYFALYDRQGRCVKKSQIATLEAVADEIHHPIWFVSSEIERYKDDIAGLFGGFASIGEAPVFRAQPPWAGWRTINFVTRVIAATKSWSRSTCAPRSTKQFEKAGGI